MLENLSNSEYLHVLLVAFSSRWRVARLFLLLPLLALAGCATNFEPTPLSSHHPASAEAPEAQRTDIRRLIGADELTQKTEAQLARKDAPTPDFENDAMSHHMDMDQKEGSPK